MAGNNEKAPEFTFEVFRFPKPKLDRKMAVEWLDNHYQDLTAALQAGYYADEKGVRADFAYLAMDLSNVLDACIHVLRTGKPVRVRTAGNSDIDFWAHMRMLARLMAQRDLIDDRDERLAECGFDEITRMFLERIEPTLSADSNGGAA